MRDVWTEAMLDGDFERAWQVSDEVLAQRRGLTCADLPYHLRWVWGGAPFAGRRVVVHCYHGLGDTLQFIRFVPQVAALADSVVIEAQPALLPLLRPLCGADRLFPLGAALPACDVAVESMELAYALRIAPEDLPGSVPYLFAPTPDDPRSAVSFAGTRLRVGLVWAAGTWRRERSVPPSLLLPLLRLPVDFVGLQLGPARDAPEAAELVAGCRGLVPNDATLAETAALVARLDLVITVDTMIAHLAGALGRPVWTMLDAAADWRWMRQRRDTPWYPTMRLFRALRRNCWEPVIEEIADSLARLAQGPGSKRDLRRFGWAE